MQDSSQVASARLNEPHSILIVGGGLAGLASAVRLAEAGRSVTLLESRPKLGGRATSFADPTTGELVDNCQHVTMGCCTYLADFCQRVGIANLLETHPTLYFQDERGTVSTMRAAPLPAPLHLAPSFAFAGYLNLADKFRIARGMMALIRDQTPDRTQPFHHWLIAHGQTDRTIERFWGLVLVSALNETMDRVDTGYARQVFIEGFLQNRSAFRVEIPRVPLGEFYGSALVDALERIGVQLQLGCASSEVIVENNRVLGTRTKDGREFRADATILAVPFHRVDDLLPSSHRERDPSIAKLAEYQSSPITSVHLWYDRPTMNHPHLVIVGRNIQWLFRRSGPNEGYVQAVISASRELSSRPADDVLRIIREEIEEILPEAKKATLRHHRVVTERRATFSVLPEIDKLRPEPTTTMPGLYLAGDYTQTGWPATMEGAVRSGYLAAAAILKDKAPAMPTALAKESVYRWLEKLLRLGR